MNWRPEVNAVNSYVLTKELCLIQPQSWLLRGELKRLENRHRLLEDGESSLHDGQKQILKNGPNSRRRTVPKKCICLSLFVLVNPCHGGLRKQ